MTTTFDIAAARAHFPALHRDHQVFFDNAGGTQVLSTVASSVKDYLEETNVQLGASYDVSKQSTEIQQKALEAAADFMGAEPDEVVFGPSTTQLFANLSQILPPFPPGSEIILSRLDHEANLASWVRLANLNSNITIKWWPSLSLSASHNHSPDLLLTPANLRPLLTPNTRLVACTHTSNILGSIHDIRALSDLIHSTCPYGLLCVDGVAYAPHRHIDVKALGADFYAFSWYKVYGPHIAVLYASRGAVQRPYPPLYQQQQQQQDKQGEGEQTQDQEAAAAVAAAATRFSSLGHYFHNETTLSDRLSLAASSYELAAAIPSVVAYFGASKTARTEKWAEIAAYEEELQEVLLAYLRRKQSLLEGEGAEVTIWGLPAKDREARVPVISFTVKGRSSRSIVEAVEARSRFGCRWGHFYSKRMVDDLLGLGKWDGVVRLSLVHYNTVEELGRFVDVLDEVLREG